MIFMQGREYRGEQSAASVAGSNSKNSSNEMTASPTATYAYDYNGNTLTKVVGSNTTSYTWDFENRLTSVTLPNNGGTVSFKYDPFGRRIYKSSSSATSIYAYDGDNLIEETNSSGSVVARYQDTQNIDEPLAMLRSSATSYYHADGLGSITSLSSAAGSIANTYAYDSFGKLTNSSGSLVNPFRYTARESDTETGLYYYRARYYDPSAGHFVAEDPSGTSGGLNLYEYTQNNPINLYDPSGLQGTKPKPAKPSPNAVFYICCRGGQLMVCERNAGNYSNGWVLDCMRQHEKKHVGDLTCGGKNPCKDQPDGPLFVDDNEKRSLECAAYRKELECLIPAGNTKEIQDRRKFIQKQIDNYCGAK